MTPLIHPSILSLHNSLCCCVPCSYSALCFFPCSAVSEEVDLRFESTLKDHAVPPAARNAGRPSYGWVSPLPVPCH